MDFALYPLHHVAHAPAKFEVATFNGLRGDAFTKNIYFLTFDLLQNLKVLCKMVKEKMHLQENSFLTLTQSRSHKMLPSTLFIM